MSNDIQVLIVDDRVNARRSIKSALLGFNCIFSEAESGEKALSLIAKNDFDVIFLDLRLPDITGLKTLRRAKEIRRDLGKVLILTGYPEEETQREADSLGVFAYLTKNPMERDKVIEAFRKAVEVESEMIKIDS